MGGARILVVDDDEANRSLMCALLRRDGYGDLAEAEGPHVVDRYLTPDLALALVDIRMPRGGGAAVLNAIRARPDLAHVKVIAVTADSGKEAREKFLASGFDEHLGKPFDFARFSAVVRALLVRL